MKPSPLADIVLKLCPIFAVSLLVAIPASSQTSKPALSRQQSTAEQRTSRAMEIARANPLDLHAFLVDMPKGADLHNHLSGAIYAESGIRAAGKDGFCLNPASLPFVKPSHASENSPAKSAGEPVNAPAAE